MRTDGYRDAECCMLEDRFSFLINDQLEFTYHPMRSFSSLLSSESSHMNQLDDKLFEIADYLAFAEEGQEYHEMLPPAAQQNPPRQGNTNQANEYENYCHNKNEAKNSFKGKSNSSKVAFKTRSEVDVLDDGYRWRKYGKKMVKNSPYPRNYYRCSSGGCNVKKKIQREQEDSKYVITTYEGNHNHPTPSPAKENLHKQLHVP